MAQETYRTIVGFTTNYRDICLQMAQFARDMGDEAYPGIYVTNISMTNGKVYVETTGQIPNADIDQYGLERLVNG